MIVLDGGEGWHLVMQPDHGDFAGRLAAAWGNDEFEPLRSRDSMVVAAARHDDGWAVRERWSEVDEDDEDGRPISFFDIDVLSHIAFYSAGITDVTIHDPYAGFMDAMHGAGLYRGRYGVHPELPLLPDAEDHRQAVDRFLSDLEDSYPERRAQLGIDENEQWTNYKLLQVFDRTALYFCGFPKLADGDEFSLGFVPTGYDGTETEIRFTALEPFAPLAPRHVRIDPYPFAGSPAVFALERRLIPKRRRTSEEFRSELLQTPTETVEIVTER